MKDLDLQSGAPFLVGDFVERQKALFALAPSRLDILSQSFPAPSRSIAVRVHRNHGFEMTQRPLEAYLGQAGLAVTWSVGDYDDSLTFVGIGEPPADLELVWLDFERYKDQAALPDWLEARLAHLRSRTKAPIVLINCPEADAINSWLEAFAAAQPDMAVADLAAELALTGVPARNRRMSKFSGSTFSDEAFLAAARLVGSRILPGFFLTGIKAIAFDLDNTLYAGVLGEDGSAGLTLSDDHRALQELLAELAANGVFLVCVSKNEEQDVHALFAERHDFPLKAKAITDWEVSWGAKSAAIARAAERLRIGLDTFLFIDDNLGELAEVAATHPAVRSVWSGDAALAVRALRFQPCLWRSRQTSATDAVRATDLKANAKRDALREQAGNAKDYLKSLEIKFEIALNPSEQIGRISEISRKTNQFNTALHRFTEVEVEAILQDPQRVVATVAMRDKLSDSGNIGALFAHAEGDTLVVDEVCISCRALSRGVEDVIIGQPVRRMMEHLGLDRLKFRYTRGPRNAPALDWLKRYDPACGEADHGEVASAPLSDDRWRDYGIEVVWR